LALTLGTRLGVYEIVAQIGEGGMGQVYRATDTALGRQVAIKILPEAFASDPERLARFEREAKTLASLNHPHIAAIYAIEKSTGQHALVMELVEGDDLSQRIARGAMPIDEALPIAKQIAEALEAAHEQGIVHRDLKPANVKVRSDGVVKVLDFGLAKAIESPSAMSPSMSQAPTITTPALMTGAGMILGTAAYMSPEQARGKTVDKRADIWAFGAVLFEMLTGKRPFDGEDVTDTLAAVVRADPDWNALPSDTPPPMRRLLRRCLVKVPKRRLADIADARFDLDEATAAPTGETSVRTSQTQTGRRQLMRFVLVSLVGVLGTALAAFAVWSVAGVPEASAISSFEIVQPPDQSLSVSGPGNDVAIGADGSAIVYRATIEGRTVLMRRRLDQLEAAPLARGGNQPTGVFVSPDGSWIGFSTGGSAPALQKVSGQGGPPVLIAPIDSEFGGATWGPDAAIVYATRSGLWRVSADGGDPVSLLKSDTRNGEAIYRWPHFLPNGRFVLFTSVPPGPIVNAQISVLSLETGEQRVLVRGGTYPRYASSGHIVYGTGGTLRAVPFRADRAEVTGGPVVVLDDVLIKASGAVDFDIASNGSLVYLPAAGVSSTSLLWVDRKGGEQPILQADQTATRPRISPDGARVALQVVSDTSQDIWVYEMARGTGTRLTVDGWNEDPVWTPDGNRLVFGRGSAQGSETDLFWAPWDGSSQVQALIMREGAQSPHTWTPDRRALAFYERVLTDPRPHRDIWALNMDVLHPVPILVTSFNERSPSFSPNGRWMAYASDETGQDEIYLRAYPGPGGKRTVSIDGGTEPIWSYDGSELFYRRGPSMVAVEMKTGPTLSIGASLTLFEGPYAIEGGGSGSLGYDVARDGQRFLMLRRQAGRTGGADVNLRVVLNWLTDVARLAPAN
jgi:serine/threonine-protein kinase